MTSSRPASAAPATGPGGLRKLLRAAADAPWLAGGWLLRHLAQIATLMLLIITPGTWRRTVRTEFVRLCYETGVRNLLSVIVTGALTGVVAVGQILYWLGLAGGTEFIGDLIVLLLVQGLGPFLVAVILIGRSGAVMLTEIARLKINGQIDTLQSKGIDPMQYLVVTRVASTAISDFCLTVTFLGCAFSVGFLASNMFGLNTLNFGDFMKDLLGAMDASVYLALPVKTLFTGFMIGYIACMVGLNAEPVAGSVRRLLPKGFMRSVLAALLISATVSLLL